MSATFVETPSHYFNEQLNDNLGNDWVPMILSVPTELSAQVD